jgi:class 3 adenylate cyclase
MPRSGSEEIAMAEADALWEVLRQSADAAVADALARHVETAEDHALNRINPLAFAAANKLPEEAVIGALVHSARLGLFDLSWNVLCPSCGGVLETGDTLKALNRPEYLCAFCAADHEPTLDEMVEVTFTVNPRVRRIAAHDPDSLSLSEYMRQVFLGSGVELPDNVDDFVKRITLDFMELGPGEKAAMSLNLPAGFIIAFDPVSHTTRFLEVSGEPTDERRNISLIFNDAHTYAGKLELRPGPARVTFENRSSHRAMPGLWVSGDALNTFLARRRPFLTANRLLSNQTFRDIYGGGILNVDQRFKITSLTIVFTDLQGSTALYDRVGDLVAFDLVRGHFGALLTAITHEGGAVVKTIGDAVMATFPTPDRAMRAAMRMREAMRELNASRDGDDLALNIGLHEGPCLAVMLDERQDYFGQTVNIAARVQGMADPSAILATKPVLENAGVGRVLSEAGFTATARQSSLRGVSEEMTVYEVR